MPAVVRSDGGQGGGRDGCRSTGRGEATCLRLRISGKPYCDCRKDSTGVGGSQLLREYLKVANWQCPAAQDDTTFC